MSFTITEEHLLSLLILIFSIISLRIIVKLFKHFSSINKNNADFKKRMDSVKKLKEEGGHHEWVTVPMHNGSTHVCRLTGFCPKNNSFLPLHKLKMFELQQEEIKEYKKFRDCKVKEIASNNNLTLEETEALVESVYDIKKQYHVKKMEKFLEAVEKEQKGKL